MSLGIRIAAVGMAAIALLGVTSSVASALSGRIIDGVLRLEGTARAERMGIDAVDGGPIIIKDHAHPEVVATGGPGCRSGIGGLSCRTVRRIVFNLRGGVDTYSDTGLYVSRLEVRGGAARDRIMTVASGGVILRGGADADSLEVAGDIVATRATMFGGGGNDTLRHTYGWGHLLGGTGDDQIFGGPQGERLRGGPGDDTIRGWFGRDRIEGNAGKDLIYARDGRVDRINCGPGRDRLRHDRGRDRTRRCP